MKKESRIYTPAAQEGKFNLRAYQENGQRYLKGYASVFDVQSRLIYENGKLFYEYIRKGAFTDVLNDAELNVVATHNHNRAEILGRTKSGTLELTQDEKGLAFRVKIPNTTLGNDTYEMVERGDYYECSFIFTVDEQGQRWTKNDKGEVIREITRVSGLYDVAICAVNGAYPTTEIDTEVAARAFKELEVEGEKIIDTTISIYNNGEEGPTTVVLNTWEALTTTDIKPGDTIAIETPKGTVIGKLEDKDEVERAVAERARQEIDKMKLRIRKLKQGI